jgi:hypothetical protein
MDEKDSLEKDIRHLLTNTGALDRDEVACLLLEMLSRIQSLEAKLKEKNRG